MGLLGAVGLIKRKKAMKEFISEEDVVKIVEKHTKGNYLISKAQAKMISEDVIKHHEEAMAKAKDIAFDAWSSQFGGDECNFCGVLLNEAIEYFFDTKENMRRVFDIWYNDKYESDEEKLK